MKKGDKVFVNYQSQYEYEKYCGPGIFVRHIPKDDPTWENQINEHTKLVEVDIGEEELAVFDAPSVNPWNNECHGEWNYKFLKKTP
jgi:hypothetical protein